MKTFRDVFGGVPAVQSEAPGRVNLLGEHTDYNDGLVLATAIAARTRIEMAFSRTKSYRVYSVEPDQLAEFSLDVPPRDHFATYIYGCLRELADYAADIPPLDMHVSTTIPIGAGLSSSAALEVA